MSTQSAAGSLPLSAVEDPIGIDDRTNKLFILVCYFLAASGLVGLITADLSFYQFVQDILYVALATGAAYGWIGVMQSGYVLNRIDQKKHIIKSLAIGGTLVLGAAVMCASLARGHGRDLWPALVWP
eukprot:gnl/Hemi2/22571_TR7531_c0_g1_i1.p1 gnl/Hemi2/22571_TR7531_c0_g1~~gnl/Hemi2/22571_TR7531_c0_g1_i1.p1  ORF type:complete len:139 (+),score=34.82 gnl/Hemi2/22571_TR7531_c0_g1_i1:37-417(+)